MTKKEYFDNLEFDDDYGSESGYGDAFQQPGDPKHQGRRLASDTFYIRIDRIIADKQMREDFDPTEIAALAKSMSEEGLINAIEVEYLEDMDEYRIISGERRFRAAQSLEWEEIRCTEVGDLTPARRLERQLVENTHRVNLNPVETARGYQQLKDALNCTAKDVAEKIGKDPTTVQKYIRILELEPEILDDIAAGLISTKLAFELARIEDPQERRDAVHQFKESGDQAVIKSKARKSVAAKPPARGVKKTATIDEILFSATSRKKKTIAELAEAARKFADQLEGQIRSKAA